MADDKIINDGMGISEKEAAAILSGDAPLESSETPESSITEGLSIQEGATEIKALLTEEEVNSQPPPETSEPSEEAPALEVKPHPLREDIKIAATKFHEELTALQAEAASINWTQLRNTNPAEYAARRQEFLDAEKLIAKKADAIREAHQRVEAHEQAEYQTAAQKRLAWERSKLPADFEQWKPKIIEYFKSEGFTDAEIKSIADHRAVMAALKIVKEKAGHPPKIPLKLKQGESSTDRKMRKANVHNRPHSLQAAAIRLADIL